MRYNLSAISSFGDNLELAFFGASASVGALFYFKERKMDNFTCARCKQDFSESDEVVYCPSCETYHHQECWDKAGGCANPKCEEYVPSKITPRPAKSTKNTSQKRNVARAHSSESIDENIEKLYTLRAGISMISMEYDRAKKEDAKLAKGYKPIKPFEDQNLLDSAERITQDFKKELSNLNVDVSGYERGIKREKVFNRLGACLGVLLVILAIATTISFAYFGIAGMSIPDTDPKWETYDISCQVSFWSSIVLWGAGIGCCYFFFSKGFEKYNETRLSLYKNNLYDLKTLIMKKSDLDTTNYIAEKNNHMVNVLRKDASMESQKYGSAMFEALRKQFAEFLSPADWENIDLLIFYFETGRALTLREALQLVDKQRQADMIVEAIESATQRICTTINHGMLNIQNTIIGCASVLSAQLSSIQAQQGQILSNQRQLQIDASTLKSALKSKSNTSSKQLMEDVHQLRVYADNLEVKRRNS